MSANQPLLESQIITLGQLQRNWETASRVADRLNETHGAIRHRMRRLEARGFVRRARETPMIVWELTSEGRSALDDYYS